MPREDLYRDIRSLAGPSVVVTAKFGDPEDLSPYKSAANKALAEQVLWNLTGIEAQWLGNAAPIFEALIGKAQDGDVTDEDFIEAVEAAAVAMPDLFDRLDWRSLAGAIAGVSEVAAVNGAVQREEEFREDNT